MFEFIDVNDRLPEQVKYPHEKMLWVCTREYGEMVGFFHKGRFMRSYACEILDVVSWLPLPKDEKRLGRIPYKKPEQFEVELVEAKAEKKQTL